MPDQCHPQITTRPAAAADLPAILEMIHALAAHHGDTATANLEDIRRDALGDAPWIRLILARRGGAAVGYAALCPLAQVQFGVRGMDMHHLFVRPEQRGIGVARALIEASLSQARALGCRYMTVGTHPDNTAAQAVYQAAGFDPLPPAGARFRRRW